VHALALGRIGEREVIVSGGRDTTLRIWDAGSGQPLGAPLTGHTGWVNGVALGRIGEREVIVSCSLDATVRIWDANGRASIALDLLGPVNTVALSFGGTLCAATGPAICAFEAIPGPAGTYPNTPP
jgi:WD40 repeat protein